MAELTKYLQQLDTYRLKHGMTQERLAELLGVRFVTVNRWLNGHRQPSQLHEYRIRNFLGGKRR